MSTLLHAKIFIFVILNLFVAVAQADPNGANPSKENFYNEIMDSQNKVRPAYATAYELWTLMTDQEKAKFLVDSKKAFEGDNMLDAMPRIIEADEYDKVLKAGVRQRADALRAFLVDHYSGVKKYISDGVIPASVIEKILNRHTEKDFQGKVDPKSISFIYGPDIIRDQYGKFRIIEDNPGWVGGLGDLHLAQDYTLFRFPQLKDDAKFRDGQEFYKRLADRYNKRAAEKSGIAVVYMTPPYPDNEDKRIRKHFLEHGIQTITPNSRMQMQTDSTGAYLIDTKDPNVKKQKIGMVVLNGELYWLDPSNIENRKKLYIKTALSGIDTVLRAKDSFELLKKELTRQHVNNAKVTQLIRNLPYTIGSTAPTKLKQSVEDIEKALIMDLFGVAELQEQIQAKEINYQKIHKTLTKMSLIGQITSALRTAKMANNLTKLHFEGLVDLNNSPGLDFIGDKEFYVYVEDLIRLYLKQEPIIRNIRTQKFTNSDGTLNNKLFDEVFSQLHKYVIKKVDGRGGDAVWVGPKIHKFEIENIKQKILNETDQFIFQEYTPLSRLNDNIVDLRIITDVGPKSTFVTDTPWGRGLPKDGDGKVNISSQGREITVLVHKAPRRTQIKTCSQLFSQIGNL